MDDRWFRLGDRGRYPLGCYICRNEIEKPNQGDLLDT